MEKVEVRVNNGKVTRDRPGAFVYLSSLDRKKESNNQSGK